jgi:aminoglycoside phosphotransferase (APT) family kinase protein
MLAKLLGDVVARGSRSSVRAFGRGAVIKVPDPSTPTEWILFEARYTEAVRAAGAPVPRLLGVEEISGRAASVWEHVEGPSMWQQVVDRPARSAELGALLADVQLALFELVPPVTLPSQRDRLASKIRRSAASVDGSLARALDLIPARAGAPRICHGDMHPSNVILGRDGPMIVDWFDVSRGDPVADVARSTLLLGDGAHTPAHLPGADPRMLRVLTGAYLARLGERLDIDPELLERWRAVNAVARLAEGLSRGPLLEVWNRYGAGEPSRRAAQAAAS